MDNPEQFAFELRNKRNDINISSAFIVFGQSIPLKNKRSLEITRSNKLTVTFKTFCFFFI